MQQVNVALQEAVKNLIGAQLLEQFEFHAGIPQAENQPCLLF